MWKWFARSAAAVLVVGLVAGCSDEVKTPVATKESPPDEIPFEEGGVKGKTFSGSHDYGRVRLGEIATDPSVVPLISKLRDAGYESDWDRSLLIEGRSSDGDATVAMLSLRADDPQDGTVVITVFMSGNAHAFNAAIYWSSRPAPDHTATEIEPGLWSAPIEGLIGPSTEKWGRSQWDDFIACTAGVASGGVVRCMITCSISGPGWLYCTTGCAGVAAINAAVSCAAGVAVKSMLGGYDKDPTTR